MPGKRSTFTWTSRARWAALCAAVALAACAPPAEVNRALPVSDGIVIAAPPGYCIDDRASRIEQGGGAFILMGSCAALSQNARAPRPRTPGVLTVTVSEAALPLDDAALARALGRYFETVEGRAVLSRSGNASAVDIIDNSVSDDALILHFTDDSVANLGLAPEHWRALFRLDGRLVTVAVSGFQDVPMTSTEGLATLRAMTRRIRAASAGSTG